MNKQFKGISMNRIQKVIFALILATILLVTGICLHSFKKNSNADALDDSISSPKSVQRNISMKVDSSGKLQINKTKPSSNETIMGKENKWTLFIYLLNNSFDSENCYSLLNNFKNRYNNAQIQENLDIIIQCCPSNQTSINEFTPDKQIRAKITTNGYEILETSSPANMANESTLYDFLDWGVENYASEHMMLSILGNSSNSFDGRYGVAEDGKHQDGLQIYEIEEALAKQSKNMTCRFDGIIFNEYNSGLLEYANLLSPYVKRMIGLPSNKGTNIWDYSIIAETIKDNGDITFDELSKVICDAYDYQCSLNSTGKNYVNTYIEEIDQKYNEYPSSNYSIGVYNLDAIDNLIVSVNQVISEIYSQLTKSNNLETLKEFSSLIKIADAHDLLSEQVDINYLLHALSKLEHLKLNTSETINLAKEVVIYSRYGEDYATDDRAQLQICMPLFSLDYEHYPADKINFYRNMVLSPYLLNTIDYLYAKHWDMDITKLYKWEQSKYYFENNFGFIPSNVSIIDFEGEVSDDMYTSLTLNESTFLELFDQKYTDYKEFTDTWKLYIKTLDRKRWISLSKSEYIKNNKYYARAFTEFKDLQKYWQAYNAAYLDTDNGYIMLGEQTGVTIDNETGIMSSEFNYEWIMLSDGQFVRTDVEKNPDKTIFNIPVYMNDENLTIKIEETIVNKNKSITILGVYDSKGLNKISDLEKGMVITPIYDIYNIKTSEYDEELSYEVKIPWDAEYGEEYTVKGTDDFLYGLLPQDKVTCTFALMKYNGNIYYDISNVEPLEKISLVAYTNNVSIGENYNFEILNNLLRGKEVPVNFDINIANNKITIISEALKKAQLTEDMTLYRGCSKKTLGEYKDLSPEELIGKTIVEPVFLSTTKDISITENFTKDLLITINAKKGAHGISLKDISNYVQEDEILFDKNQSMLIIAAEEKDGILNITVTIE